MVRNDSILETYASFSTLHNEFLQLSRTGLNSAQTKTVFIDEPRIIEGEQHDYRICNIILSMKATLICWKSATAWPKSMI
jgi:hypothetical protein